MLGVIAMTVLAPASVAPSQLADNICVHMFSVYVGDAPPSQGVGLGKSIAKTVQGLNQAFHKAAGPGAKTESWAEDIPDIVKLLRKLKPQFLAACRRDMGKLFSPCAPYQADDEAYGNCLEERSADLACWTNKNPWEFLLRRKPAALDEDRSNLARLIVAGARQADACQKAGDTGE